VLSTTMTHERRCGGGARKAGKKGKKGQVLKKFKIPVIRGGVGKRKKSAKGLLYRENSPGSQGC